MGSLGLGAPAATGWEEKVPEEIKERPKTGPTAGERTHGSQGREGSQAPDLCWQGNDREAWSWKPAHLGSRPGPFTACTWTYFPICKTGPRHQPYCAAPIVASPAPFLLTSYQNPWSNYGRDAITPISILPSSIEREISAEHMLVWLKTTFPRPLCSEV